MPRIRDVVARKVFDSRGVETLEVEILTEHGSGRVAAPFGAPGSRGQFEVPAYPEGGVDAAVKVVTEEIRPKILGAMATEQGKIDEILCLIDGTGTFARIGGNTASSISLAVAKAAASALGMPLYRYLSRGGKTEAPRPLGNIIGGGAHAKGSAPDMQEHLVVPLGPVDVRKSVLVNIEVHQRTGQILEARDPFFAGGMDDERAWVANLTDVEALETISIVCEEMERKRGIRLGIGLDLAADRLWNSGTGHYEYRRERKRRTAAEQLSWLSELIERYNLVYVEDPFHSDDYESFAALTQKYGSKCLICGDDLLASSADRLQKAIELGSVNAMVLKLNQVGTITKLLATINLAREAGIVMVISHRSGETEDVSISHFALAWGMSLIKTGVIGGERISKLNELLRIGEGYPTVSVNQLLALGGGHEGRVHNEAC
jgi:enolase